MPGAALVNTGDPERWACACRKKDPDHPHRRGPGLPRPQGEGARRRRQGQPNYRLIRYADLCRARHKSAYAESRVMPILVPNLLVRAVSGFLLSA